MNNDVYQWIKKKKKIDNYLPIQAKFIESSFQKENLIVSAPTTSGKTLIAEIRIAEIFFDITDTAIIFYIAPLKSLVNEKIEEFRYFKDKNVSIKRSGSGLDKNSRSIIICTPERVLNILSRNPHLFNQIKLCIFDEIHLISDTYRGLMYEFIISLFISLEVNILGLSASISNRDQVANWINSHVIHDNTRAVDLHPNFITYFGNTSYYRNKDRRDKIKGIVKSHLDNNDQILIFEASRPSTRSLSIYLTDLLPENKADEVIGKDFEKFNQEKELDRQLLGLIKHRIAYHNSDLSSKHKKVIEKHFNKKNLKIIVSTSSLAMGINFPIDAVIIAQARTGRKQLTPILFHQMIGRAGRYMKSDEGYWYVLLQKDKATGLKATFNPKNLPPLESVFDLQDITTFSNQLIWILGTGIIDRISSLKQVLLNSFYENTISSSNSQINTGLLSKSIQQQNPQKSSISDKFADIQNYMIDLDLIRVQDDNIELTKFGFWIARGHLDISKFMEFYSNIFSKNSGFKAPSIELLISILENLGITVIYFLTGSQRHVTRTREYLVENGVNPTKYVYGPDDVEETAVIACMLYLWINGFNEDELLQEFGCYDGSWETRKYDLSSFLGKFTRYAPETEDTDKIAALRILYERIEDGVPIELVPLTQIKDVGRQTAFAVSSVYPSLYSLKQSSVEEISEIKYLKSKKKLGKDLAVKIIENLVIDNHYIFPPLQSLVDWADRCINGSYPQLPETEFRRCIEQSENLFYELKSELKISDKEEKAEFIRDVMSFLNARDPRCRIIIYGVNNSGKIIGHRREIKKESIIPLLEAKLDNNFQLDLRHLKMDKKSIYALILKPGDKIVKVDSSIRGKGNVTILEEGEVYTRGNTGKIKVEDKEINKLIQERTKNFQ